MIKFLKTVPSSDQIPYNILQIIEPNSKNIFNSYKLQDFEPVQLSSLELKDLKNIRDGFDEIYNNKSIGNQTKPPNEIDSEIKEKKKVKEKNNEDTDNSTTISEGEDKNENTKSSKEGLNSNDFETTKAGPYLVTSDIDWLFIHIKNRRNNGETDIPYLHTLLEGASIEMPENEKIKRNPVLEARCVKLRAQQEAREYRKMTKGVDNVRMRFPEDSISYQMKQLNRHLIAIGQFILSIFAGFLFGFRGVEWMVGNLDFGFRLLLGVMCALVIALAEIYFLAKKLNEELCIPETVQLGGPVKFADQDSYNYKNNESLPKPHQD
ncbi:jg21519 [Pararge aegeria aegeria]|uniref:Jg21519 protein n=2 Tax=Pararge aegeria TaxID=116150 RepID=A0A8S4RPS7_9NEOP|nr:jg21519 [Pararge aegeria aegeria]